MTKQEAEKKIQKTFPNLDIKSVKELDQCFVFNLLPKDYDERKDGLFIGGAMRVDKKTGDINLYNPMLEGMKR